MKRFHFGETAAAGGGEENGMSTSPSSSSPPPARVFECKTCNRQFPSFQALGGHRASHKKPRLDSDGDGHGQVHPPELAKPKVHECSICGLTFTVGQALGGHMRRHRAALVEDYGHGSCDQKKPGGKRRPVLWFDLNMPADEEKAGGAAVECRKQIFGFEVGDRRQAPMVVDLLQLI